MWSTTGLGCVSARGLEVIWKGLEVVWKGLEVV